MKPEAELALVLSVLERRGVDIRSEPCGSAGGLVRIGERYMLFLNPATSLLDRIDVALDALRRLGAEKYFLPPRVRDLIEKGDVE